MSSSNNDRQTGGQKGGMYTEFSECLSGRGDVNLAGLGKGMQSVPAEFKLRVVIDDFNKFVEHKEDAAVFGTARMPTLSPYSLVIMEGRMRLVAPDVSDKDSSSYQMRYELPIEARSGARFLLVGTKSTNEQGVNCGGCGKANFDATKMICLIHEGDSAKGKILGEGLLQIAFMDAMKMLFSFQGRGSGRFKNRFLSNVPGIYIQGLMPKAAPAFSEDVLAAPQVEPETSQLPRGSIFVSPTGKRRSTIFESLNIISNALLEESSGPDTPGADGDFEVSNDEIAILRAGVQSEFPDDYQYLSDAYIKSMASKPYSKDKTKRRPLEYTQKKLRELMQWRADPKSRADGGAAGLEALIRLANESPKSPEAVGNPQKLKQGNAIAKCLNSNSTYFHGLTKDGRPILWIRTDRRPWYPDIQADMSGLTAVTDVGIRGMPEGITDFVAIIETRSPPPPNPAYMISSLETLVKGYPDRASRIIVTPVGGIVQFVMKFLKPIMPGTVASKLLLLGEGDSKASITDLFLHGEDDLPNFLGGKANHDQYYPLESKCPNRGDGILKFDYFGMVERLAAQKKEYEAMKAQGLIPQVVRKSTTPSKAVAKRVSHAINKDKQESLALIKNDFASKGINEETIAVMTPNPTNNPFAPKGINPLNVVALMILLGSVVVFQV